MTLEPTIGKNDLRGECEDNYCFRHIKSRDTEKTGRVTHKDFHIEVVVVCQVSQETVKLHRDFMPC